MLAGWVLGLAGHLLFLLTLGGNHVNSHVTSWGCGLTCCSAGLLKATAAATGWEPVVDSGAKGPSGRVQALERVSPGLVPSLVSWDPSQGRRLSLAGFLARLRRMTDRRDCGELC